MSEGAVFANNPGSRTATIMDRDIEFLERIGNRTSVLFLTEQQRVHKLVDFRFALMTAAQWVALTCVVSVIGIIRLTQSSASGSFLSLWSTSVIAGAISVGPILLGLIRPGHRLTRYAIAAGQMLMAAWLIHVAGGRPDSHLIVFASLGLLALYREQPVLLFAAAIAVADHVIRGIGWPASLTGVASPSPLRWMAHVAWLIAETAVLFAVCKQSLIRAWDLAERAAQVEALQEGTPLTHRLKQHLKIAA